MRPIVLGVVLVVLGPTTAAAQSSSEKADVRTGERVYQERVAGAGSFSASPVAADGKIYLSSEDGDVFVVKAGPTYALLATNHIGQTPMATPAISDGTIIIRGLKDVFAIRQKS